MNKTMDCPRCDGKGVVPDEELPEVKEICPDCFGSGKVEDDTDEDDNS